MKKKVILGTVIILTIGAFITVAAFQVKKTSQNGIPRNAIAIDMHKVAKGQIVSKVTAKGQVLIKNSQKVYGPTGATIKSLPITVGQIVKKGQILVTYDNLQKEQLESQLKQSQLSLEIENLTLTNLKDTPGIPKIQIQMQNKKIEAAQLQISSIKDQIDSLKTQEVSEIDGVVISVKGEAGGPVDPTGPIVEVADLKQAFIKANISQYDGAAVAKGQDVSITADNLGATTVAGKIDLVYPTAQTSMSQSGEEVLIPIEVSISDKSRNLIPGTNVDLEIITTKHDNVITIPITAIIQDSDGKNYVFVVNNYTVAKKEVTLGPSSDINIEVAGLTENDTIISSPSDKISVGTKVKPLVSEK